MAGFAGALALASTLAFVIAFLIVGIHGILETPPVRRQRARRAVRIARQKRRDANHACLEQADAPTHDFVWLADLVDRVAAVDESTTVELEELLDRYVELVLARTRCRSALDQGQPAQLELSLALATGTHPHATELLERRIAQSRSIAERLSALDDSVDALADLVRYYAERASLSEVEPLEGDDALAVTLAHYDACQELDDDPKSLAPESSPR